ncbi:MAG: DUF5689 domain-containing protein [Dysgonomonas sp.]
MKRSLQKIGTIKLFLIIALTCFPFIGNAQLLLTENFEYADGDLIGQGDWVQQGSVATFPLQVVNNPLTYAGYLDVATGKSVALANSGQDAYKVFEEQTSGDTYYSALVNFTEVQSSNAQGEYFIHFGEGGSSFFGGRVMVKKSADGTKMQFGITRAGTSTLTIWDATEYELNITHLIVVKYSIVAGEKNDVVSLFVNPETSGVEPSPNAVSGTETGADISSIKSIGIRQGTGSRTPLGHIGALRVAKSWAELFGSTPVITPKITLSPKNATFGMVYKGTAYKKVINVKGENLKGDITVSGLTSGEVTASATTITKEQAEAEGGFDLSLILNPVDDQLTTDEVLLDSEDATQAKISCYWSTTIPIEVFGLDELRTKYEENQYATFRIVGNVNVSHVYVDGSKKYLYIQDNKRGITIDDTFNSLAAGYKTGDRISGLLGTVEKTFGTLYFLPSEGSETLESSNNTIKPIDVTVTDLETNPTWYEARLIRINRAEFYNKDNENGGIFTEGTNNKIRQGSKEATMRVFKGADFIGNTIPEKANITGVLTSASGKLIAPRTSADIALMPAVTVKPSTSIDFESVEVGKDSVITVYITTERMTDFLWAKVMGEGEAMFTINTTLLPKESNDAPLKITFKPKKEGTFNERIALYSASSDTVFISATGKGIPAAPVKEGDDYPLVTTNPLTLLDESFGTVEHNKVLSLEGWKNIAQVNTRAWWGYTFKDENNNVVESSAKVTAYNSTVTDEVPYEMWLYTPALDFKNSASKMFTFRVMGDLMTEGSDAKLELYYADMEGGTLYTSLVDVPMPSIPDENKDWREFHMDLEGQNIADVFFMAFRFSATGGTANSAVYYIDDVTYGKTDIPQMTIVSGDELTVSGEIGKDNWSESVEISTKNLTEDVYVSIFGKDAAKFTPSVSRMAVSETLKFNVNFKTDDVGTYEAYIKISSRGAADQFVKIVAESFPLSIESVEQLPVRVNITGNNVTISADRDLDMSVYSVAGVAVGQMHITAGDTQLPYTLSGGVYILKFTVDGRSSFKKIMIP